jgi:hypothetical protein
MTPYLLDAAATDSFFRQRSGQLNRRWRGSWPVRAVHALAAQHLKVSIEKQEAFREGLKNLRRDVGRDIFSSLSRIGTSASEAQIPIVPRDSRSDPVRHEDQQLLVGILTEQARGAPAAVGIRGYYRYLIQRANLPIEFKDERLDGWTGSAGVDASELVNWALSKGTNPVDRRQTVLGSILLAQLSRFGLEAASAIVAVIFAYKLVTDERLLGQLAQRYQVPRTVDAVSSDRSVGPSFAWKAPDEAIQLQGLFRPDPVLLDVGFLRGAIERATSVCRIEVDGLGPMGTGVLIDRNLVLTNYHLSSLHRQLVTSWW